ncbi:valine--tRNA ligase [bacterium]|nr:valine--tRNA ligase [bacterium]
MDINKKYSHKDIEQKWYKIWEERGYFTADPSSDKPPFSIVLPPPNVTGVLHMGHTVMAVVQDIMARYKRMDGFDVLWLPGTDHAGIATQMVVERKLMEEGISRHDIGREKFLEKVWEWKEENGSIITKQLRHLGTSLDWTRERFTMDEGLSKAVKEVFVRLYEDGLIYRSSYIINWCPRCRTALSDLEVDHQDKPGKLWYISYPVAGEDTALIVATTRPETMLGDTAVAVHPEDERYKHLIGKMIKLPLTDREIPIVGDATLVDMEFGTGAVKVTPAHDFNDFETGKRHNLEEINVIDEDGKITEVGGKFAGMTTTDARKAIVEALESEGLLLKIEEHGHSVGHCDRCKTVVEPQLSKQWFVKIQPLADPAIKAVEDGDIVIQPEHWKKTYFEWMYNIRDWCISRQLWWGHRIPAWYCEECGEITVSRDEVTHCHACNSTKVHQDSDVLDTWFSSALWPFSTLGWPEKTPELKKYYKTSLMETGFDIIFFWVARMIMMGEKFMGEIPFEKVYFHGLVRDEKGQKMSKTKGNVIDPLVVTEQYGADALRFTFAMMPLTARDIKLSMDWIEGYSSFINKVFNATRFSLMQFPEDVTLTFNPNDYSSDDFTPADKWILTRLNEATKKVRNSLEEMRFHDAAGSIYHFFWHEFCDWYIELVKPTFFGENEAEKEVSRKVLLKVLDASLKLLHPFMPHVTEELWQSLPFDFEGKKESIMISDFPQLKNIPVFEADAETMGHLIEIISTVRTIRSSNNIKPKVEVELILDVTNEALHTAILSKESYIKKLARVSEVRYESGYQPAKEDASAVVKGGKVFLPLAGLVDFSEEIARLQKELKKVEKDFKITDGKLKNPRFLENANPQVVEKEKKKHTEMQEKVHHLTTRLEEISQ